MLKKTRPVKIKSSKTADEKAKEFWEADPQSLFNQNVVALVSGISISTLEKDRYFGRGIPFRKSSGRIVYKKSDVVKFLEDHHRLNSTHGRFTNGR